MKKAALLLILALSALLIFSAAALADGPSLSKITITDFSEPVVYQHNGSYIKQAFSDSRITMSFSDGSTMGNGVSPQLVTISGLGDYETVGDSSYAVTLMLDSISGTSYGKSTTVYINGKSYKAKLSDAEGFLAVTFTYTPKGASEFISSVKITGFKTPEPGMTVYECLKKVDVESPCTLGTVYSAPDDPIVHMYSLDESGRQTQLSDNYVIQAGDKLELYLCIANDGIRYDEDSSGNAKLKVYLNGEYRSDAKVYGGKSTYSLPTIHLYFTVEDDAAKINTINVTGLLLPEDGMTVAQCKKNVKVDAPCVLDSVDFAIPNGIVYTSADDSYVFKAGQKVQITVAIKKEGVSYELIADGDAMLTPYLNGKVWTGAAVYGGDRSLPTINFNYTVPGTTVSSYSDVKSSDWFYGSVASASKMGLIQGFTDGTFRPTANLTYAQTIKLAACMNQLYTSGSVTLTNGSPNWYDSYVDYCQYHGIISSDFAATVRSKANQNIDRQTYVEVFANSLPDAALSARNSIPDNSLPDVKKGSAYYNSIYKLYRAGVLVGNDPRGTFAPEKDITRAEVSAIVVRMMDATQRKDAPSALGQ